ncbi:hypothetical protein TSAR_013483 [Trichomalopsis sarcophagae]|uniref:Uncharacterized protein n=1 Tax=Trichomalopsis sarcophagae TaxID=543379 RepID=A0A232FJ05_9HYME|nr:hypothetical protein TSAR_013483 [Trichomalopsis sarcophagae]
MSWITSTATAILLVVAVTCSPIDVPEPARELLPPKVDSGPSLDTDLVPPPVSVDIPDKNHAFEQNIADAAESTAQEMTNFGKLMNIRGKRHLKGKKSYGGGCGGGCGGGYYQRKLLHMNSFYIALRGAIGIRQLNRCIDLNLFATHAEEVDMVDKEALILKHLPKLQVMDDNQR